MLLRFIVLFQVLPGEDRSALSQAAYQLIGLAVTIVVAVISGIFTGLLIYFKIKIDKIILSKVGSI